MRVRFPAYRRHRAAAVVVDDAMMALLIGARLGQHTLANSAASEGTRLPAIYGRIPDIERLNRTVGDAARLLGAAEHHLVSMAIPYVLGIHADFITEAIRMLREDGHDDEHAQWNIEWQRDLNEFPLSLLHEYFIERSGVQLPNDLLALFHLTRRIRNRIIHSAGRAGSRLPREYRQLSVQAREKWERVTGRPLTAEADGQLLLGAGELHGALSFTRALARETNDVLAQVLSRNYWLRVIIEDYRAVAPQHFGERAQRVRRVTTYAMHYYGPLSVREDEVAAALGEKV